MLHQNVTLGIDVGGSAISYAVFLNNTILHQERLSIDAWKMSSKAQACKEALLESFDSIYCKAQAFGRVETVGIGFPGKRYSSILLKDSLQKKNGNHCSVHICEDGEAYLMGILHAASSNGVSQQKPLYYLGIGSGFGSATILNPRAAESDLYAHTHGTGLWNHPLAFHDHRPEDSEDAKMLVASGDDAPRIADNILSRKGYTRLCEKLAASGYDSGMIQKRIGIFMGNRLGYVIEGLSISCSPPADFWIAGGILHEYPHLRRAIFEAARAYIEKYSPTPISIQYAADYLAPLGAAAMARQQHHADL